MSKSLGNGITVNEIVKRVKPEALRYFMLSTHYRSPLNFSDETMAQATGSVERIANSYANLKHRLAAEGMVGSVDEELGKTLSKIADQFAAKMGDDFNTPDAITALFELVTEANLYMARTDANASGLQALLALMERFDNVLGLLPRAGASDQLAEEVEALIAERTEARKTKNWARADEIRDRLNEMNVVVEDTPQGIRWRRK
jgi:cysteinyl-tRNA synthetase